MRRWLSDRVQFTTWLAISCEFGTITSAPAPVRRMLARMPMRLTLPLWPAMSTESPTRIGRSNSTIRPDTKLLTMLCKPKPTPTPTALAKMVKRSRLMPVEAMASSRPPIQMA